MVLGEFVSSQQFLIPRRFLLSASLWGGNPTPAPVGANSVQSVIGLEFQLPEGFSCGLACVASIFKGLRLTAGRRPTWVCGAYVTPMLALVGPILSKVKLFGAHLGPRLGQVGPMWSMLGTSWAHVEPMLGLGWPMLGLCLPMLA